ncbi:hypothetical protein ACIRP7_38120 [Streptomyces sp. NPDC102270]|uniref:hypothetical protein n=1 Tax=Streptomyces sp. NPDC102270 TaxID=3366150 RepID=UPI0038197C2A
MALVPRMYVARVSALAVPLTAAEQDQVHHAAEAAGQRAEDFMHDAIMAAASGPLIATLDQVAGTITEPNPTDRIRHDYAN